MTDEPEQEKPHGVMQPTWQFMPPIRPVVDGTTSGVEMVKRQLRWIRERYRDLRWQRRTPHWYGEPASPDDEDGQHG